MARPARRRAPATTVVHPALARPDQLDGDDMPQSAARADAPAPLGRTADDMPPLPTSAPLNLLAPSPMNPRKRFDPVSLAELAQSIWHQGLLQPIVTRPLPADHPCAAPPLDPDAPDDGLLIDAYHVSPEEHAAGVRRPRPELEILAGERRWRAYQLLVEGLPIRVDGVETIVRIPADTPVPVVIRHGVTDTQALQWMGVENLQRADMTAIEECDLFARMADAIRAEAHPELGPQGGGAEAIVARMFGITERSIFRRLRLLDLCPEAREAAQDGTINKGEAEALALGPADAQRAHLALMLDPAQAGWARNPHEIKRRMKDSRIEAGAALFDLALYDGPRLDDPDEPGSSYLADVDQFRRLQRAALDAKKAELIAAGAAFAEEVPLGRALNDRWAYLGTARGVPTGYVIRVSEDLAQVQFLEGYVTLAEKRAMDRAARQAPASLAVPPAAPAAAKPAPEPDPVGAPPVSAETMAWAREQVRDVVAEPAPAPTPPPAVIAPSTATPVEPAPSTPDDAPAQPQHALIDTMLDHLNHGEAALRALLKRDGTPRELVRLMEAFKPHLAAFLFDAAQFYRSEETR